MIKDQIFINYNDLFASISWPHPDISSFSCRVTFNLMGTPFLYSQTVFAWGIIAIILLQIRYHSDFSRHVVHTTWTLSFYFLTWR